MWDLPGPEIKPVSPALAGGLPTTSPPGTFRNVRYCYYYFFFFFRNNMSFKARLRLPLSETGIENWKLWTLVSVFKGWLKVSSQTNRLTFIESVKPTQLCLTSWTVAHQAPSVHGILSKTISVQARILEWVTISFSRDSSWPRDQTWISYIAGILFTIWATKEAQKPCKCSLLSHVQLHVIPRTVECQAPLSMGNPMDMGNYWNGLPFPPPGNLLNPGNELVSPMSIALELDSLLPEPPRKPL